MAKQIFINLAVKDLQISKNFYEALGFSNNPQFSDDTGKCMVWSENIFVMILTLIFLALTMYSIYKFYKSQTELKKLLSNAQNCTENPDFDKTKNTEIRLTYPL